MNGQYPTFNVQVVSGRFGNMSTIVWQADFDDLATLNKFQESFNTDEDYWALVNNSNEFFIEDSITDIVYQTL